MRFAGGALFIGLVAAASPWGGIARAAPPPSIDVVLDIKPVQKDIEYDIPDPKTHKQCKVSVISEGKMSGWVVTGPAGQTLRVFMDTDGDEVVDQRRFFRAGIEVYRDMDTNRDKAGKIDQSRWLNLGGTRWGIDTNEDGRIDVWKVISPDEVSRIAVRALVTQDATLLAPLLVTKEDLKGLGIKGPLEAKLLAAVADPGAKLRKAVSGSKIIQPKTVWLRFDASPPSVIPADSYKTADDLYVYENAMALVDSGNPQQPGLVILGELLRVGDAWKLTGLPAPMEGKQELAAGLIMFHGQGVGGGDASAADTAISEKMQELIDKYRKLAEGPPAAGAGRAAFEKYHKQVENVLIEVVNESKTDEERAQWTRQLLDTIAAAVQSGNYPSGVARLEEIGAEIKKASPKSPLVAVAAYRAILAGYYVSMQGAEQNEAKQKVHEKFLGDLEEFLDEHPKAEDAADAGLQLAVALEFSGKLDRAKKWYERVAAGPDDSPAAQKARGASTRIDLVDKTLELSGSALAGAGSVNIRQHRGKVVLVLFWDTGSALTLADLPALKELYEEYRGRGFEVIGVNLDVDKEAVAPYLSRQQVKWPQIHEPGGMESPLARSFGINSTPTMFLVDAEGKVTNRNATVADVRSTLEETFSRKSK